MTENNFNSEVTEKNMDGYFYLNSNNEKAGPVVPTEFSHHGINGSTMIWKEGMSDWMKAGQIPELSQYFRAAPPPPPVGSNDFGVDGNQSKHKPMMPDNNMLWAVMFTVFGCLPIGIYSIVQASKVNSLYLNGQYNDAQKMADGARKWACISAAVVLVIYWGIFFLIGLTAVLNIGATNP